MALDVAGCALVFASLTVFGAGFAGVAIRRMSLTMGGIIIAPIRISSMGSPFAPFQLTPCCRYRPEDYTVRRESYAQTRCIVVFRVLANSVARIDRCSDSCNTGGFGERDHRARDGIHPTLSRRQAIRADDLL